MKVAPYGTWRSPIAAADLARSAIRLDHLGAARGVPYWIESRPQSGGRSVIVSPGPQGGVLEWTSPEVDVRSRVHEYGGTPFAVRGDRIYFVNFADQRLYVQAPGRRPAALTPAGYRYADFDFDPSGSTLLAVREDHTRGAEPANAIVALDVNRDPADVPDPETAAGTVLYGASDFAASPRASLDGRRIAWIAWNHPDMPWNSTTLFVADRTPRGLEHVTAVAGGPGESVVEPRWDTDGTLYFVSDRSGWWNLYRSCNGRIEPVFCAAAELARPLWTLGQANYALTGDGRAVVRWAAAAEDRLAVVDLRSGERRAIELPYVDLSSIRMLTPTRVAAIAASATEEAVVVEIDLATGARWTLRAAGDLQLDRGFVSIAEPIDYPTSGGLTAHAFFYFPVNAEYRAPPGEKPPLIVKAHGGPTSHSTPAFNLATQYWTSRGFAVLDVNYGGSSGYGRSYRERLDGQWGIVDVEDVVAGARHLADTGRTDPGRAAIRGSSAGGFTVLAALAFHDVFEAGANYYGVSDLEAIARDTHKFESRYLDRLVAPLPEGRDLYAARAPIRHLERFRAPLITFQGAEDKVVPASQSRAIVAALEHRGVRVAYLEFEGEQHGFRRAESLVRSLEAELAFYGEVFGFAPSG